MSEARMVVLLTSGVLLWLIGGTWWKPARRWVWPLLACGIIAATVHTLAVLLCLVSMIVVNHLGYGEQTTWWKRFLIFTGYAACTWWISPLYWWVGILFGLFLTGWFWFSRVRNEVTHKTFESLCGSFQSIALIIAVNSK